MPRFYETTLSITNLHNLSISTHVNCSRIYQMLLGGFEISHHSITLQEPLRLAFEALSRDVNDSETYDFNQLFPLFIIAATMGNSSFLNYDAYKFLLEKTKTNDLSLIALEDMWFRLNYRELSKEQKSLDNIAWIRKKLLKQMQQLGGIAHLVNIPINKEDKKVEIRSKEKDCTD